MLALRLDESFSLAHLLGDEPADTVSRRRRGLAASALAHAILVPVLGLITFEPRQFRSAPEIVVPRMKAIPLVAPRLEQLTQKDPNTGVVSEEINLESLLPQPSVDQTAGSRPQARQMAALPARNPEGDRKAPDLLQPPAIDAPVAKVTESPLSALGSPVLTPSTAPPTTVAESKPKIQFEKPGSITGSPGGSTQITVPNASVSEAIRAASESRGTGGNQVATDFSLPSSGGLSSRPGRSRGSVELLSDPNGIDFKPYLIQVLAAVKRNWFAVMPESARFGRRGQVRIMFAVSRNGDVPKLVIANSSGFDPFDRAAVAGVSASNPFPPLPREFLGNEVRLQFTFSYNLE